MMNSKPERASEGWQKIVDYFDPFSTTISQYYYSISRPLIQNIELGWRAAISWRWTPICIVLTILILLLAYLSRAHRRWKNGWLSNLIDIQFKHSTVSRFAGGYRRWTIWKPLSTWQPAVLERWDRLLTHVRGPLFADFKAPYLPSVTSFIIVTILVAIFFLVPHWPPASIAWNSSLREHFMNLAVDLSSNGTIGSANDSSVGAGIASAFTGLAVLIVALIVFVAESIRDDSDFERKRDLVRISWLWPLGLSATLVPFGLLWSPATGLTVLIEVIIAALTIFAFARVLRSLLDPKARANNRIELLRSRVGRTVYDTARERTGNRILLDQLGPGKRIDTFQYALSRSWMNGDESNYIYVEATSNGRISDIQLDELKKLGDWLDRYAREKFGFSLRESITPAPMMNGTTTLNEGQAQKVRVAYLLKRYHEEVSSSSVFSSKQQALLALPAEFQSDSTLLEYVETILPHIFRFTTEEPTSAIVRREMQGTKDQLAQAIRALALGSIDDLRQTYIQIAEEFLTQLVALGGGYTAEQAKEESNAFQSWSEVGWLRDDLRELAILAFESGNISVASSIGYLPFGISVRAVQARDHYLFQRFLQFAILFYDLANSQPNNPRMRAWLLDRSWRWPKEIVLVHMLPDLTAKEVDLESLRNMADFARYSQRVFQDLLKLMAERLDTPSFTTLLAELQKLFRRVTAVSERAELTLLGLQIEQSVDPVKKAALEKRLLVEQERHQIATELRENNQLIYLALGGWLFAKALSDLGNIQLDSMLKAIRSALPGAPGDLAEVYAAASAWRASDTWGWNDWGLIADGEVHYVDRHTNLNLVFCALILQQLAALPPAEREKVQLPANKSFAEMAQENNDQGLLRSLDRIEREQDLFRRYIGNKALACIGVFRNLLAEVRKREQAVRDENTRNAELDDSRLSEFRTELCQQSGRLRPIFSELGVLDDLPLAKEKQLPRSLGYRQIDDKNAFIRQEHTSYAGWGRSYGEGLAQSEDAVALQEIISGAGKIRRIAMGSAVSEIEKATRGFGKPIVLQSLEFEAEDFEFNQNNAFTAHYDQQLQSPWKRFFGFKGVLDLNSRPVPVFDVHAYEQNQRNLIVVFDGSRYLHWEQYPPSIDPSDNNFIFDRFLIKVVDLNADKSQRDAILKENPAWLSEFDQPEVYLRSRALVEVYEKFEIKILDPSAAACFRIDNNEEIAQS